MSDQQLSDMIGTIYDAALDPALWPDALEQACQYVGGCGASIYSKDSVSRTADITHGFGVEDKFRLNYVDEYVKMDPTTPGFFFFGVEEIVTTRDILPYDEFLDTRFYKEWVQPQRWVDMVTAVLEKSTTSYAVLTVFRHERDGLADDGARHRMKLLMPHVRRAVLIGKTIQLNTAEAATLADTLDSLAAAMFLVDATGRLLQANVSGHALIGDASVVKASGGRLVANHPVTDQLLRDALTTTQGGHENLGTQGISLPLPTSDGQHYVAHILPLTAGARRAAQGGCGICRNGGGVRAQGAVGGAGRAGSHRKTLQADAERASCSARRFRIRRRVGYRRCAWHLRSDS